MLFTMRAFGLRPERSECRSEAVAVHNTGLVRRAVTVTCARAAVLLSCRVQATDFTYPPHSIPLVEAYEGRFEAAFVVLHPFVRVPAELAWSVARQYPSDAQIAAHGSKCPWAEVAAATGLSSLARISQALLTAIGSLPDHLADPFGRDRLQHYLQSEPVWMPTEGCFEALLQPDFLRAFTAAGAEQPIFVPEFPNADPVVTLTLDELRSGTAPFPPRGTLLAPDHSFLFTVDWDSFFTLFYGTRQFVTGVAAECGLEGFFALPTTEHSWFNYSMGCATVTLSPEHWQTRN